MSFSNYAELEILDWIGGNGAPAANATPYVKLHIGDPGEDGTLNAAAEATRQAASFAPAAAGAITTDADLDWLTVAATETYSHISLWDAAAAGNCLGSGALTAPVAVTAGDNFKIPAGDLDITLN